MNTEQHSAIIIYLVKRQCALPPGGTLAQGPVSHLSFDDNQINYSTRVTPEFQQLVTIAHADQRDGPDITIRQVRHCQAPRRRPTPVLDQRADVCPWSLPGNLKLKAPWFCMNQRRKTPREAWQPHKPASASECLQTGTSCWSVSASIPAAPAVQRAYFRRPNCMLGYTDTQRAACVAMKSVCVCVCVCVYCTKGRSWWYYY